MIVSLDEFMESGLPQLCIWLRANPMCGRFTFQSTEAIYERFQLNNQLDALTARYNIAPGQMVPVIIAHSPRQFVRMRWGLVPHWAKDEKTAYKMINARVETLTIRAFRLDMSL